MSGREIQAWVCLTFDVDGRVSERGIRFGNFAEVSEGIMQKARGEERGYELAGAVIANATDLDPAEVVSAVRDALAIKLSPSMGSVLSDQEAAKWCRTERAVPVKAPVQGGVHLTGPLGRTRAEPF
ncbi:MAG TPA: hypothetical protein VGG48_19145 [Rhizomicrobium sp.]|jgi:hypothetical protein